MWQWKSGQPNADGTAAYWTKGAFLYDTKYNQTKHQIHVACVQQVIVGSTTSKAQTVSTTTMTSKTVKSSSVTTFNAQPTTISHIAKVNSTTKNPSEMVITNYSKAETNSTIQIKSTSTLESTTSRVQLLSPFKLFLYLKVDPSSVPKLAFPKISKRTF